MMENQDRPHVKAGPIKYTKGYRSRRLVSKLINFIIGTIILSIAALSIFVFIKQPVKTADGYITATPIYEFIEYGENVVVIEDENYNMFTPLKRFLFTQEAYLAKIVAGPYGEIELYKDAQRVSDGVNVISVNLGDVEYEEGENYLDMDYIVRKIDENREPLENEVDKVIKKENILGKVNFDKK